MECRCIITNAIRSTWDTQECSELILEAAYITAGSHVFYLAWGYLALWQVVPAIPLPLNFGLPSSRNTDPGRACIGCYAASAVLSSPCPSVSAQHTVFAGSSSMTPSWRCAGCRKPSRARVCTDLPRAPPVTHDSEAEDEGMLAGGGAAHHATQQVQVLRHDDTASPRSPPGPHRRARARTGTGPPPGSRGRGRGLAWRRDGWKQPLTPPTARSM